MQDNTNDDGKLRIAMQQKASELKLLKYPEKYINKTLKYMARKTKSDVWLSGMSHTQDQDGSTN